MGILPAASIKIKEEMNLSNIDFGTIGSIVYIGQTLGSILATGVLQSCNAKFILCSCLFLNIFTLVLFTLTNNYLLLLFCRMCTGMFQVFFCIYMPIWTDTYGNDAQKTKWLTYMLISSPLGVIIGYGMAAVLQNGIGWRWAFYIQSIMLLPSMVGLMITPSKYYEINGMKSNKTNKKKVSGKTESTKILNNPEERQSELHMAEQLSEDRQSEMKFGGSSQRKNDGHMIESDNNDDGNVTDDDLIDRDQTFCQRLCSVISNMYFLLVVSSITILFFIITGIQYWISDYMITVLKQEQTLVFICFGIISITGPVLGIVIGGNITNCLGGY
jgi:MFS family permease